MVDVAEPHPAAPRPVIVTLYVPGNNPLTVADVPTTALFEFTQV
jgi:hypothetical protein